MCERDREREREKKTLHAPFSSNDDPVETCQPDLSKNLLDIPPEEYRKKDAQLAFPSPLSELIRKVPYHLYVSVCVCVRERERERL